MSFNNNTQGPVGAIKHNDDRRAAIPTTELAGEESMAAEKMSTEGRYRTFKNEFNRGRDPELYWQRRNAVARFAHRHSLALSPRRDSP